MVEAQIRVLQVVQRPQRRGAEVFAWNLSERLRNSGHEVGTVYLNASQGEVPLSLLPGDNVLDGGIVKLVSLRETIRNFRPDVVQANGGGTLKYCAMAALMTPGRRWKLLYRNIGYPEAWIRGVVRKVLYRKLVMPMVDGIVSVSEATLSSLQRVYGRLPCHIMIPRGVPLPTKMKAGVRVEIREKLETPSDSVVVVYVGSLSSEKRVDRLLRCMSEARRVVGNLDLWIIGDGVLRDELESQSSALGLEGSVRFLGMQSEVSMFLSAADVLALTSETEGMPGVVLEAGACGLPTVATDVGGVRECVRNGVTGFVVPANNEKAFAEQLIRLASDAEIRTDMGTEARLLIEREYSIDSVSERFMKFYQQVVQAG